MKPEDLQRLVTVAIPFGKYQGRLIADLPSAYLSWFARKGFPRGDLGNLLALMLELDHMACDRCSIHCASAPRKPGYQAQHCAWLMAACRRPAHSPPFQNALACRLFSGQ
jgi:uncharacterized protein (DUF3820 family)